jgi:flagellar hook-length control protein FliK
MDLAVALRAAAAATMPTATPVERNIPIPVHDRHWPQAVAAQLQIMSDQKVQAATLRLSPEHLGPLEVRIDLQNSRVDVTFTAAHSETRAALEQSIPQLREVLAGAGLTLGQANVQQQARRESQNPASGARAAAAAGDQSEAPAALVRAIGMVDEYV